jgi:hypothetical protein
LVAKLASVGFDGCKGGVGQLRRPVAMVAKVELDSCDGCKAGAFAAVFNWVFPKLIYKVMVFIISFMPVF